MVTEKISQTIPESPLSVCFSRLQNIVALSHKTLLLSPTKNCSSPLQNIVALSRKKMLISLAKHWRAFPHFFVREPCKKCSSLSQKIAHLSCKKLEGIPTFFCERTLQKMLISLTKKCSSLSQKNAHLPRKTLGEMFAFFMGSSGKTFWGKTGKKHGQIFAQTRRHPFLVFLLEILIFYSVCALLSGALKVIWDATKNLRGKCR